MSVSNAIDKALIKLDVYNDWSRPKHWTKLYDGFNRHRNKSNNYFKHESKYYNGKLIPGGNDHWELFFGHNDNKNYLASRKWSYDASTEVSLKYNGEKRTGDADFFKYLASNVKVAGRYHQEESQKQYGDVPGVDFDGTDFSYADLRNTNFGRRTVKLNSITSHPVLYKINLWWKRAGWNNWYTWERKSHFPFNCSDSGAIPAFGHHKFLVQNRLSSGKAHTLWTSGNGRTGWFNANWPDGGGGSRKVPQKYNLSTYRGCMYSANYEWLSASTFNNIRSGGVRTNRHTKLPHGWIESGGFLLGPTADLSNTDISGISIKRAALKNADLDGIKSENLLGTPSSLPPLWNKFNFDDSNRGLLIGPKVNLRNTDLGRLDLSSLSDEHLYRIKSGGTKGEPKLPDNWKKRSGFLFGPYANFNGSNLAGINLNGLNLTDADLRNSDLSEVRSGNIIGLPILPDTYDIIQGYIFGPHVDLSGADLSGINVRHDNPMLNLHGAAFDEETVTDGLRTGNIIGDPVIPNGWGVLNKHLIAPGVDLVGADLSDSTFTGLNLYSVDLRDSDLDGVKSGGVYIGQEAFNTYVPLNSIQQLPSLKKNLPPLPSETNEPVTLETAQEFLVRTSSKTRTVYHGGLKLRMHPVEIMGNYHLYRYVSKNISTGETSSYWNSSIGFIIGDPTNIQIRALERCGSDLCALVYKENEKENGLSQKLSVVALERGKKKDVFYLPEHITYFRNIDQFYKAEETFDIDLDRNRVIGNPQSPSIGATDKEYWANIFSKETQIIQEGSNLHIVEDKGNIILYVSESSHDAYDFWIEFKEGKWKGDIFKIEINDPIYKYIRAAESTLNGDKIKLFLSTADPDFSEVRGVSYSQYGKFQVRYEDYEDAETLYLPEAEFPSFSFDTSEFISNELEFSLDLNKDGFIGNDVLSDFEDGFIADYESVENYELGDFELHNYDGNLSEAKGSFNLPDGWSLRGGYLIGPTADLSGAELVNLDLRYVNLGSSADLSNAVLTKSDLRFSTLDNVDLSQTNLTAVKSGGILGEPHALPNRWFFAEGFLIGPGANLSNSDLYGINFRGKNITGIDLSESNLRKIKSGGVIVDPGKQALLPEQWHLINGFLLGPTADLRYSTLSNISLPRGIDLSEAKFKGIKSNNISGNPLLPSGWKLIKPDGLNSGFLIGPGADLENADFSKTNLTDVNLGSLDLRTSNLDYVRSKRTTGTPQLPSGWKLDGGYLLGPKADLSYAKLYNLNLDDVDLRQAILSQVTGYKLKGKPQLPNGWGLVSGYLFGPDANLSGLYISDADLNNIDLRRANLTNLRSESLQAPVGLKDEDWLPLGWRFYKPTGTLIGNGAHLKNITLSGDLSDFDFRNVKSSGIQVNADDYDDFVNFPIIRNQTYGIFNGHIVGPGVNLTRANLEGVDFGRPEDRGWDAIRSLKGADLFGVKSGGILTDPKNIALPRDWNLVHGYLVGPGKKVDGRFKPGADLTEANFEIHNHPHFQDGDIPSDYTVDLSQTDLTGIISNNITWDKNLVLRPGWASFCPNSNSGTSCSEGGYSTGERGGYFLGERVILPDFADLNDLDTIQVQTGTYEEDSGEFVLNMRGAILTAASFDRASLQLTNFEDATLTRADLSNVIRIINVNFKGADLRGASLKEGAISDSDFSGADLTGAQIGSINLEHFNQNNIFDSSTICPDGTFSNGQGCFASQLID